MADQTERKPFADPNSDVEKLFGAVSPLECETIKALFPVVSDMLRFEAEKVGKDIDKMVETVPGFKEIVKWVVFDVVSRYLTNQFHVLTDETSGVNGGNAAQHHKPVTQTTHSAGGYSVTNTYQTPVPGLFIKKSELARLGLRRQQVGVISFGGSV